MVPPQQPLPVKGRKRKLVNDKAKEITDPFILEELKEKEKAKAKAKTPKKDKKLERE